MFETVPIVALPVVLGSHDYTAATRTGTHEDKMGAQRVEAIIGYEKVRRADASTDPWVT